MQHKMPKAKRPAQPVGHFMLHKLPSLWGFQFPKNSQPRLVYENNWYGGLIMEIKYPWPGCFMFIIHKNSMGWVIYFHKSPRCGYFFHIKSFFHIVGILCRKIPPREYFREKIFLFMQHKLPPIISGWSKKSNFFA